MKQTAWAVAFVVLWSSGFVGAVLAEPAGSLPGLLAWRYVATAIPLLAVTWATGALRATPRAMGRQAALGLLSHVVFLGGVFGATASGVDAGTVALACAMQPMLVAAVGHFGWGDRFGPRPVLGLLIGFIAVVLSVGSAGVTSVAGLVLPVASLLGLSTAALLERRWKPTVPVLTSLSVQVSVSAIAFVVFAATTSTLSIAVTPRVAGALVWLVILSGLGGYAAFIVCLRQLGSTSTSLLLYLTPPVTTVWAWLMFADLPTVMQLFALLLSGVGVLLAWPRRSVTACDATRARSPQPAARAIR